MKSEIVHTLLIYFVQNSGIYLKAANKHINAYFAKMRHSVNA